MPNGQLAVLGEHLEQDRASSQLRAELIGRQIEIGTPIATHRAQIHLPIQSSQPAIGINPLGEGC